MPVLISDWLIEAVKQLKHSDVASARLDAEIILAHTLKKSRTWLHAHGDEELEPRLREIADARLELRKDHTPIAYIIGHKEFYGRRFAVTPSTLIPRPESETLIDLLKKYIDSTKLFAHPHLVDVGTGSGCLGITAKLELPECIVTLTDTSRHALTVARKNAQSLEADIETVTSDLLSQYPFTPDIIIANLPYVDRSWYRNQETDFEPAEALFAEDDGLRLIKKLCTQATARQRQGDLLLLEADPRQHRAIQDMTVAYNVLEQSGFALALQKI